MRVHLPAFSWRTAAGAVLSLVCVLAVLGVVGAQFSNGNRATSMATQGSLSSHGSAHMMGTVDLRKLSAMKAGQTTNSPGHASRDRMTTQQRAAYWAQAQRGVGIPKVPHVDPRLASTPSTTDPKFLGGAIVPPYLVNATIIDSPASDAANPPDMALATDLSYVMTAMDATIGIYRASNGTLIYGPYSADSFFQLVKHAGDTFSDPQMNYDVMRDHWIVTYLEWTPGGLSYLDIAVSTSTSPTQPTPGAQYHEFEVPTTFLGENTACDYQTLGVEYYSLTVTCVEFDTSNVFKGNTTIVFDKNSLLNSNTATYYTFNNAVPTSLNTCSGPCPAFRLSPAIEDGVQDGEFIVATDAGYGVTSSNLTLCALTNLNNVSSTAPTLTCGLNNLGISYADPLPPQQTDGHLSFTVGLGTKQIYYKAGRLFVSFASAFTSPDGAGDAPIWAEVQPQLSTQAAHSPQWVNGALIAQASNFFFLAGAYSYNPVLIGTDEGDMLLTFNQTNPTSNHTTNSQIVWTGRKATDAPNTMGQDAGTLSYKSLVFADGEYVAVSHWSDYAACAVPLNSVTRGKVWCIGAAAGDSKPTAWWANIYELRLE